MMIKTITVTEKDYFKFADYAFKRLHEPQQKGVSVFIKDMIIWLIIAMVLMFIFKLDSVSLSDLHWPSVALTAFPFMVFIIFCYINMRNLRQSSAPNKNGLMLGEKTIEFGAEGITETNSLGKCFYKWGCVEAVKENDGDLYIFLDKLLALIIPAASFASNIEKEELQAIVKKYT